VRRQRRHGNKGTCRVTEKSSMGEEDVQNSVPSENAGGVGWYILCLQSGKEDQVIKKLNDKVEAAGLASRITRVLVPTEKITEIKSGKKRVVERKLYPGYIMLQMDMTDELWFVIRETPGIGDFVGSGEKPLPMEPHEVDRMLNDVEQQIEEKPKLKISFREGESVKIKEGPFENFDGMVESVQADKGLIRVVVSIFGRDTPVELEYWQVESI